VQASLPIPLRPLPTTLRPPPTLPMATRCKASLLTPTHTYSHLRIRAKPGRVIRGVGSGLRGVASGLRMRAKPGRVMRHSTMATRNLVRVRARVRARAGIRVRVRVRRWPRGPWSGSETGGG